MGTRTLSGNMKLALTWRVRPLVGVFDPWLECSIFSWGVQGSKHPGSKHPSGTIETVTNCVSEALILSWRVRSLVGALYLLYLYRLGALWR